MDKDNKTVGTICLDNTHICKIVDDFVLLINASITDPIRANQYRYSIMEYRAGMTILQQKTEYADDEIINFQHWTDNFFKF